MRVLIATDAWYPQVNGVVQTLTSVGQALERMGVEVSFLTPEGIPSIPLPTGMYVMGPIFQDEKNLLVAHAFQQATDFHTKRPPAF